MAIENRNLPVATRLVATYKQTRYFCTVEEGEEGKVVFVLEDGSRYKSLSAAGSKVMGGKAVNGWRFWTVEGDEPAVTSKEESKTGRREKAKKSNKTIFKALGQQNEGDGEIKYFCNACMEGFLHEGTDEPERCPKGHRNDDAALDGALATGAEREAS